MMEVQINPAGVEAHYLDSLNLCFGGWGDARAYDWTFRRPVGGPAADLMVLRDDGALMAGSAVVYRTVRMPGGEMVRAGIMTGSWTLPEARGKGCFSTVIRESAGLARQRGSPLLLAYVTAANASFRRLEAAGAALVPTHYCVSGPETPVPRGELRVSPVADLAATCEKIHHMLAESRSGRAHFHYTIPEWTSQFVDRPTATEVLAVGDAAWCVVEKAGDTDRLLALVMREGAPLAECLGSLLRRAQERGRKLFHFCTSAEWHDESVRLGLTIIPGYLTILGTGDGSGPAGMAPAAGWSIQSGDRM